jgi:hypothetical protein
MSKISKKELSAEQKATAARLIKGGLAMASEDCIVFFCEWDKQTFLTYG